MKRMIALLLALALICVMFAGCGSSQQQSAESTDGIQKTPVTIGNYTPAEAFAGGCGTESDPYQIADAAQLALLAEKMQDSAYCDAHYVLTADISLNDTADLENWDTTAPEYVWEPIGRTSNMFSGVFDGNGHVISGMYILADANAVSDVNDRFYGLFARVSGTVKNLTIEQSYICVSGANTSVGFISGQVWGDGVVEDCAVYSGDIWVRGDVNAGGISGHGGVIQNCQFAGIIAQKYEGWCHLGGIIGYGGTVSDCSSDGIVSGYGYSGGIAGWGEKVENCVNKASVLGDTAGGIAGNLYRTGMGIELDVTEYAIRSCTNEGAVVGNTAAGGIVGKMGNDEVDISMHVVDCENFGNVCGYEESESEATCAGIIGILSAERASVMTVENCVNQADLSDRGKVGGIIGELKGAILHQEGEVTISGCTNNGNITSSGMYSGGIVTYFMLMGAETDLKLNIADCVNTGNITSANHAGGILCFSTSSVAGDAKVSADSTVCLKNCSNSGVITSQSNNSFVGGIVGNYGIEKIQTLIEDCTNSGTVKLEASLTEKEIQQSINGGAVMTISQMVGGIVGRIGEGVFLTTDNDGGEVSSVDAANARIVIRDCRNTGALFATDYSEYKTEEGKQIWVNYIGGIVGNACGEDTYSFRVEDCTYNSTERGLGNLEFPDVGLRK